MKYLIVVKANCGDEFDVVDCITAVKEGLRTWELATNILERLDREIAITFGTNEEFIFERYKLLYPYTKVTEISDEFANLLNESGLTDNHFIGKLFEELYELVYPTDNYNYVGDDLAYDSYRE